MKLFVQWFKRNLAHWKSHEQGQNAVEMAIVTPFMMFLILAIFEMGQVFYAYLAIVNTARDGTIYASLNPIVTTTCPDPIPPVGTSGYGSMTHECKKFAERLSADVVAASLDTNLLTIARPISTTVPGYSNITVTLSYKLSTFSSGMSMPFFGRMGLPNFYDLRYSLGMLVRYGP
ncbi:MAG: pilus assembly protein [Chloroflexi bacterium]|nr:pilus assembly protein [Chloroflexota bacterium]